MAKKKVSKPAKSPKVKKKARGLIKADKRPTVVAVTAKELARIKDKHRGNTVKFTVGRGQVLTGIDIQSRNKNNVRVIDTETFFSNIEEITKIYGFVEVCNLKWDNRKAKTPYFIPVSEQERSELKSEHEEKVKRDLRWKNPKPFRVPNEMPILLLSHSDYVVFRKHILTYQKEIQLHTAIHNVLTINGKSIELSGYILRGHGHFIAAANDFVDAGCITSQITKVIACNLAGQYGTTSNALRIVKNTRENALEQMLEAAKKPLMQKLNTQTSTDTDKTLPKPNPSIVRNRQTWHSPLNLSFDLDNSKKIQLYSQKCHCSKCAGRYVYNSVIDCTAKVTTKSGQTVPVTVQYCTGCGAFFMNYATYKSYDKQYGGLKFRCQVDAGNLAKVENDSSFADDSFLSRNGYNVNANTSKRQRQAALACILDNGIASKYEVAEKISGFINLRKNNPHMADAIDRWEEDLAFVAGYQRKNQPDVGKREFEQKGKITQKS